MLIYWGEGEDEQDKLPEKELFAQCMSSIGNDLEEENKNLGVQATIMKIFSTSVSANKGKYADNYPKIFR